MMMEITRILIDWIANTTYLDKSSTDVEHISLYNSLLDIIKNHNGNIKDIEVFNEKHSFRDSILIACQYMLDNNPDQYLDDIKKQCIRLWKKNHVDSNSNSYSVGH